MKLKHSVWGKKWIQVKNENGDPDQHCIKGSQEPWGKCVP